MVHPRGLDPSPSPNSICEAKPEGEQGAECPDVSKHLWTVHSRLSVTRSLV